MSAIFFPFHPERALPFSTALSIRQPTTRVVHLKIKFPSKMSLRLMRPRYRKHDKGDLFSSRAPAVIVVAVLPFLIYHDPISFYLKIFSLCNCHWSVVGLFFPCFLLFSVCLLFESFKSIWIEDNLNVYGMGFSSLPVPKVWPDTRTNITLSLIW